jgi:hypothetical protein
MARSRVSPHLRSSSRRRQLSLPSRWLSLRPQWAHLQQAFSSLLPRHHHLAHVLALEDQDPPLHRLTTRISYLRIPSVDLARWASHAPHLGARSTAWLNHKARRRWRPLHPRLLRLHRARRPRSSTCTARRNVDAILRLKDRPSHRRSPFDLADLVFRPSELVLHLCAQRQMRSRLLSYRVPTLQAPSWSLLSALRNLCQSQCCTRTQRHSSRRSCRSRRHLGEIRRVRSDMSTGRRCRMLLRRKKRRTHRRSR